jgi:hypothetical protein
MHSAFFLRILATPGLRNAEYKAKPEVWMRRSQLNQHSALFFRVFT